MSWERQCPRCRGEMEVVVQSFGPPTFLCPACKQTQQPWEHTNPKTAAVMAVLQDWFEALEEGRAEGRFPQPDYERRNGRPAWTDAEVNQIIAVIDYEIHHELAQRPGYWQDRGFTAPSDFDRLGPSQRRAMVQEIDRALAPFDAIPREPEEPIAYG